MSKLIPLSGKHGAGKFAIVDDDVYEEESKWKWMAPLGYVIRLKTIGEGRPRDIYQWIHLHRVVTGARSGEFVDHIDGNKLNNQRSNLRICSLAENNRNIGKLQRGVPSSQYKGVFKKRKKWAARIAVNGETTWLGVFLDETAAARAYDAAAKRLHGEFARLNFPDK